MLKSYTRQIDTIEKNNKTNQENNKKSKRRQNRSAAFGTASNKITGEGGGALTYLRSSNTRPLFCLGSSDT